MSLAQRLVTMFLRCYRMSSSSSKSKKERLNAPKFRPGNRYEADHSVLRLKEYAEMMTNPKDNEPVRTPSEFASVGDIKTFTRTFSLEAGSLPGGGGDFAMVVSPEIENFFALTKAVGISSAAGTFGSTQGYLVVEKNDVSGLLEATGTFQIQDAATLNYLGAQETQVYEGKQALVIDCPIGAAITATFTQGSQARNIKVWVYDVVGAAWVLSIAATPVYGHQTVTLVVGGALFAISAVALEFVGGTSNGATATIAVDGTCTWGSSSVTYDLFNSDAVQLGKVERYRVTAMSILCSYVGNQFNDGGVIAAARTQPGYVFGSRPYESLTKLLDHRYYGPMKNGAYCWWLPNSLEEREYKAVSEQLTAGTELRVAGTFADPTGTLQITICVVVEFYSPLQIFSHNIGPVVNDPFYAVLHDLDTLPAATCNPLHADILKFVKKGAKRALGYVVKNPQILAAAAKSIASMM